jgi:HEAT repeat protein
MRKPSLDTSNGSVAEVLGQIPASLDGLISTLRDGESGNLPFVASALGELGDPRALEPLIRNVLHPHRHVRLGVSRALRKLGHAKWARWITGDDDDFGRVAASEDAEAIPLLTEQWPTLPLNQRRAVVRSLSASPLAAPTTLLIGALRDPDPEVCAWAGRALGRLRDPLDLY